MRFVVNTQADQRRMLEAIGCSSIDDLFADIPEEILGRFRPLGLPGASELEVQRAIRALAARNAEPESIVSFQGGGVYDHHVPSVVRSVTSRSEFATAYTPYQPEISQGTLTAMFEFQSMICELAGMEIANASMYDGATSLAEAALMAARVRPGGRILVSEALFPHWRRVLETYCWAADIDIVDVPISTDGGLDRSALDGEASALIVQTPNAFGVLESLAELGSSLGDTLLIVACNPLALALVEPPGALGADIVVGEGQPLGLPMSFGGPLLGLFATRRELLRQIPGRIVSRTLDTAGNAGFTLAAQTREQHIRRERATSNICTNAALCALAATVFLALHGARGLKELSELNFRKAHYAARRLVEDADVELAFSRPFFNEFTIRIPEAPERLLEGLRARGLALDPPLAIPHPQANADPLLRIAVTERRTKAEIDHLVDSVKELL